MPIAPLLRGMPQRPPPIDALPAVFVVFERGVRQIGAPRSDRAAAIDCGDDVLGPDLRRLLEKGPIAVWFPKATPCASR